MLREAPWVGLDSHLAGHDQRQLQDGQQGGDEPLGKQQECHQHQYRDVEKQLGAAGVIDLQRFQRQPGDEQGDINFQRKARPILRGDANTTDCHAYRFLPGAGKRPAAEIDHAAPDEAGQPDPDDPERHVPGQQGQTDRQHSQKIKQSDS